MQRAGFRLRDTDDNVKLYVCYGTFKSHKPGGHPCRNAHEALRAAGHDPEVVKTYGCFRTDPLFHGRRKIKELTGNYQVPTLELDDGTLIDGTESIRAWAGKHRWGSERTRTATNPSNP